MSMGWTYVCLGVPSVDPRLLDAQAVEAAPPEGRQRGPHRAALRCALPTRPTAGALLAERARCDLRVTPYVLAGGRRSEDSQT